MPGIDGEIKRPINHERIAEIDGYIEKIKAQPQTSITKEEIEILKEERQEVQNPENLLKPKAPYDVVVLFDVPTPQRFSGAVKEYIQNAKKVIYIDHHPYKYAEWKEAKAKTGIDMAQIHKDGWHGLLMQFRQQHKW